MISRNPPAVIDALSASADETFATDQFPLTTDDGAVPHLDAGDIGDGVERTGCAVEGNTQVACAGRSAGERMSAHAQHGDGDNKAHGGIPGQ